MKLGGGPSHFMKTDLLLWLTYQTNFVRYLCRLFHLSSSHTAFGFVSRILRKKLLDCFHCIESYDIIIKSSFFTLVDVCFVTNVTDAFMSQNQLSSIVFPRVA